MDKPGNPETHVITISLEANQVKCDPLRPKMEQGDTIVWQCEYPFAIHFMGITPVEKVRLRSKGEITSKIQNNAQFGCYKYFVALEKDGEIWTDDPDVIIRRPRR